jgi:tetratricopeptide (TPR) repeat protein
MKKLTLVLLFAAATCARAAFPDAEAAGELLVEQLGERNADVAEVTTGAFVEGGTPDQALAAVRVDLGYYVEVYPTLFARDGDGWRVADAGDPIMFMPEMGGDEGTFAKNAVGDVTYYAFTCTEASYGSGMGTEYDYYILYRVDGDELADVFEDETVVREEYYSRWYGGEDSSAWAYGGSWEAVTAFAFDDVDGDGTFELWALTRESPAIEAPATRVDARLFAVGADGKFVPADVNAYYDALAAADSFAAKVLLARTALTERGDAAAARAFLEEAAALDPATSPIIDAEVDLLARFAQDPPEAVMLYYRDDGDDLRTLAEEYADTAAGAEAVVALGDLDGLATFLKKRRNHERWPEAYAYAVREALYTYTYEEANGADKKYLSLLKKNLKRYLKLTADAEEKARTATHLADCFYYAGDFTEAGRLYKKSLAVEPHSAFEDYNYLRLGDCAAATGDDDAAIGYYADCVASGGWWGYDGSEMLLGYAAVREGSSWRYFLDYLDERGDYKYMALEAGDLDGADGVDFAALVQWQDEPHELYYFLRTGDEFRGEPVMRGRPSLWAAEIVNVFESGPQLLACNETTENEEGRATYRVLSRYDGSAMREVARMKIEETRTSEPGYAYAASVAFADALPSAVAVTGTSTSADGETAVDERYIWSDESFSFIKIEP